MNYEVGDTVVITVGKGKRRKFLRVVAVTEADKLGRFRTRTKPRRKRPRTR